MATTKKSIEIKRSHDPFNGAVVMKQDGKKYSVHHERKATQVKGLTKKAAEEKFNQFVADTLF